VLKKNPRGLANGPFVFQTRFASLS